MDATNLLEGALLETRSVAKELPTGLEQGSKEQASVIWLATQLSNVEASLQAMLNDIEAGCSLTEMGFFGTEFEEMVDDMIVQIASLKGLIRTMKSIGQGG